METEIKTSLPAKLASLRKQKGLTQMELAEKLNVSRQAISSWEVGAAVPSTDNLKVLSSLYEVSIDYLLNDKAEVIRNPMDVPKEAPNEQKQNALSKNRRVLHIGVTVIAVLLTAIISAVITSAVITFHQKENRMVPLADMCTAVDDGYSEGTFIIE